MATTSTKGMGLPLHANTMLIIQDVQCKMGCFILYVQSCCCPATPLNFASGGGGLIFQIDVYQSASPSIWSAVQSLQRSLSTNPGVTTCCLCVCSCREGVCRVCECYREGIMVMDMIWCRLCVSMILGRVIYLLWKECDK